MNEEPIKNRILLLFLLILLILSIKNYNWMIKFDKDITESDSTIDINGQINASFQQIKNFDGVSPFILKNQNTRSTKCKNTLTSRNDFDKWGIISFEPVSLDDPNKVTIYAGLKKYKFRFTIDDFHAFKNVTSVTIEILDYEKNYSWIRSSRDYKLSNTRSRNDEYSAGFYKIAPDLGYLDFNITFPWTNNNQQAMHNWIVKIIEHSINLTIVPITFNYYVNNEVKFIGTLIVDGENQGTLKSNDWVQSKENISWAGLKIVYDSPLNIVPPQNQAQIILYDENENSWLDISNIDSEMQIYSKTSSGNDLGNEHEIKIIGPGEKYLKSSLFFTLRVDADGVHFFNVIPKHYQWEINDPVTCRINISDNITSGVDTKSINYNFSKNNGKTWSGWMNPEITSKDSIAMCSAVIKLQDGDMNFIWWRGKDLVGNQYSYSKKYRIKLDSTLPEFKNPAPKSWELQYDTFLNCSIEIFDEVSGVDGSSIQYSYKLEGQNDWSTWKSISKYKNNNLLKVKASVNFDYGEFNFIKWRSKDVAGNEYVESDQYRVNISHKRPKVYLISPKPNEIINESRPTFKWADSYKMVQKVSYSLMYWLDDDPGNITNIYLTDKEHMTEEALLYGQNYSWYVVPETIENKGNCESGILNFSMNTFENIFPVYNFDITPTSPKKIKVHPKDKKDIEIVIHNIGNQNDLYLIELMDPFWEEFVDFEKNISVLANGTKQVSISIQIPEIINSSVNNLKLKITSLGAKSLNQTKTELYTINVNLIEEDEEMTIPFDLIIWGIIIIVILVVISIGIYFVTVKAKYKKFEKELMRPGRSVPKIGKSKTAEVVYEPELTKAVDRTSKGEFDKESKNDK